MKLAEKILIIVIAFAALAAAIIGFWLYQNRPKAPEPEPNLPTVDEFFPIDTNMATEGEGSNQNSPTFNENAINQNFGQGMEQIVAAPIVNFDLVYSSTTAHVLYTEKSTGHLYQKDLLNEEVARLSNYTAPALLESYTILASSTPTMLAVQASNGQKVLIDHMGTTVAPNLIAIAVNPDKTKTFVIEKIGDSAIGSVTDWKKGGEKKVIFRSPLTEWVTAWPTAESIGLTTRPAGGYAGFHYTLDAQKGTLKRILSDVPGLQTLESPNGQKMLYSTSNGNRLRLNLVDHSTGEVLLLGVETLAEKCTWSANGLLIYCAVPNTTPSTVLPDAYYRGEVVWSDNFWQIDASTGEGHLIFQPTATLGNNTTLDVTNLVLNPVGNRLYFQNRRDTTLWSLSWE